MCCSYKMNVSEIRIPLGKLILYHTRTLTAAETLYFCHCRLNINPVIAAVPII